MSSIHTHLKDAADAFPDEMDSSRERLRGGFPAQNPVPVPVGVPTRPHAGDVNHHWIWFAVAHHPNKYAQHLRTIIMDILKSNWWNTRTPRPDGQKEDPFDQLVDDNNRCVICLSNGGKACYGTFSQVYHSNQASNSAFQGDCTSHITRHLLDPDYHLILIQVLLLMRASRTPTLPSQYCNPPVLASSDSML
ncbi:SubName: Full=Uncharacterized protein {ECO:0000313/EMBL:CCA68092.1} [Serendipita indica DSM 11827]|nr:SubName: Full=Uncharacterized protein {ECO:0000313/EMBL:CCA68092.1} [Serendipita indica DSM 11827]